eukprot:SAG22_NODE_1484_length_4324_cov_4.105799_1_plen_203_part_00
MASKPVTAIGAYPDPPPVYDPATDKLYPLRETAVVSPIIPKGAVVVNEKPLAYYVDNFVTEKEREHIKAVATPQMSRARVSDTNAGQGSKVPGGVSGVRTNSVAWLTGLGDEQLEALEDRLCDLTGWHAECTEEFQVIYYEPSQQYRPHFDAYDTSSEHGAQNTVRGGNRMITMLIYLSDVEEGGGTSFPNLKKSVAPKPGD